MPKTTGPRPRSRTATSLLGWQAQAATDRLAMRGGGVDDPVGQRLDPDAAGFEESDDVHQVTQATAEPVDLPDDQSVAGAQIVQACLPLRAVGLGSGGHVFVDLEAVLGGESIKLQLRILVGSTDSRVPDLVSHRRTLSELIFSGVL
jgi:hypothetical protein